jgi:uncharacterized coiled-coil protein SlyX
VEIRAVFAALVAMLTRMAKQWSSVDRKQEKLELLSEEISNTGEVSWKRVLEITDYDRLVYKLTLKYLRQKGYDIGNNTIPRVKNSCM